jgi:predicted PhzF superfamily epimerase YddE/YHI9
MPDAAIHHVDAFTAEPFAGNPAAVVVLDRSADVGWMQRLADDMNLSETAFVVRPQADETDRPDAAAWGLRWFTPAAEVELCGHATLASAHTLWRSGLADPLRELRFATRFSGELTCTRNDAGTIAMDFPADPPRRADPPGGLVDRLGVRPVMCYRSTHDWIVEVASPQEVADADPDFAGLADVPETRGVALTAAGTLDASPATPTGSPPDFVSRFFAPSLRIEEDPVTGSLHCALGPLWSARLSRSELVGHQCSRRGGVVRVTHATPDAPRVRLAGQAVTLSEGRLVVPVASA